MKKIIIICCLYLIHINAFASQVELNAVLVRVINQINALMPLLDEASSVVDPNARIQLHIDAFEGSDGKRHPGVRDDLFSIRTALIDYINTPVIEPKVIKPFEFDFIGK